VVSLVARAWRRRWGCLTLASLGCLWSRPAGATESTVTVHEEAVGEGQPKLSCTDADSLTKRVRALRPAGLGFGASGAAGQAQAPHFEVTFSRRADRSLRAVVNVTGALSGERVLTDPGPSCEGLGEALAVTLALLLDGSEVPEAKAKKADEPRGVRGQILLQGGVVSGFLPSTAARLGAELVAHPLAPPTGAGSTVTLELGGAVGYLPTVSTRLSVGEVRTNAFLGSLRAGARIGLGSRHERERGLERAGAAGGGGPPFAIVPSLVTTFGSIRAEGSGYDEEAAQARAFATFGVAVPLVVEPASFGGFVLRLTPSVDVATRLQSFAVTGVPGSVGGRRVSAAVLLSAGLAAFLRGTSGAFARNRASLGRFVDQSARVSALITV
jgi:hypothetical protein